MSRLLREAFTSAEGPMRIAGVVLGVVTVAALNLILLIGAGGETPPWFGALVLAMDLSLIASSVALGAALTHRNGWSGCFLKDHGGVIRVGLALDAADGPRFVIQDEAERPIVSLP